MKIPVIENNCPKSILRNALLATVCLFVNGFGICLTIQANIGVAPWDVLNTGLSRTFGILYGTASISVALAVLLLDILMKEPVGIAMIIDAFVVGKSVDFCNWLGFVPQCSSVFTGILMMLAGFVVMAFTQYIYMLAALGCGPRDTLMVGLARRLRKVPIGVVSIAILSCVTLAGYLLGGSVGIGTLMSAFGYGPIMQTVFDLMKFDATKVRHQRLRDTCRIVFKKSPAPDK